MKLAIIFIRFYQFGLKSFLGISNGICRYSPTCSNYTEETIFKYGALKGMYLGLKRILSCHPFA